MPDSDVIPPANESSMSLDAAIECCLIELERNPQIDANTLIQRFPRWAIEISEFLENWTGMRQMASWIMPLGHEPDVPDPLSSGPRTFGD